MKRRLLAFLAVLVASLGIAASARAVTLVHPNGVPMGPMWQRWVAQMRVPTVDGTVVVHLVSAGKVGACPGTVHTTGGCAAPGTIWINHSMPRWERKQALYHELGHQFDFAGLFDPYKSEFLYLWHLTGLWTDPFGPVTKDGAQASAREWFAEAYRLCANNGLHREYPRPSVFFGGWWHSGYTIYRFPGYKDPAAMHQTCRIIKQS